MKARPAKVMEIPEEEKRLEKQLCFAVYATAHAFTRAYKPILDKVGLTYPQYLVMLVLWEKAELPVKTIGEQLDLDSGTLSLSSNGWNRTASSSAPAIPATSGRLSCR